MSELIPTRVGIGIIGRGGTYLIRQRRPGQAMSDRWEFPGGKCEAGETPEQTTARECLEEVGLEVVVQGLRFQQVFQYPHGLVELFYYDCVTAGPDSEPAEETGFRWVEARALRDYHFPDANEPVIEDLIREAEARTGGGIGTGAGDRD